jgi:Protein of unknown function (DUF3017)
VEKAVLTGQGERSDAAPANASAAAPASDDHATSAAAATTAAATADPAAAEAAADPAAAEAAAGPSAIADAPAVAVPGAGAVPVTPEAATAEVQARARAPRWANLPYAIVLIVAAGGLSWVALGGLLHVQAGMTTVASALLAAAVLRLVLPERAAGLLVSRRRVVDVVALASLGAGIMATVLVLPMP